jgi:hypothetical protein
MKTTYNIYSVPFGFLLLFLFTLQSPANANDDIDRALAVERMQTNLLFNPTPRQLEFENKGRVNIYDGLKDTEVARALDTQFDRMQSMMFVRTVVTDNIGEPLIDPETGNKVLEDDDCD